MIQSLLFFLTGERTNQSQLLSAVSKKRLIHPTITPPSFVVVVKVSNDQVKLFYYNYNYYSIETFVIIVAFEEDQQQQHHHYYCHPKGS